MMNVRVPSNGIGPFRLKKLQYEIYQIHSPKGAFEGSRDQILAKALSLGVQEEDLIIAIEEMIKNDHNCAEFGISGRFIYTKNELGQKSA